MVLKQARRPNHGWWSEEVFNTDNEKSWDRGHNLMRHRLHLKETSQHILFRTQTPPIPFLLQFLDHAPFNAARGILNTATRPVNSPLPSLSSP